MEVATYVAAPSGGLALARLGADVIRIDPLGGASDHHRWPLAPGGGSLYWTGLNKGKRSVAVDLRSPRGQELVTALVTERGTLLDNTVGWGWLADERLRASRPDLVHVRVQGRPDGGPALDYTVNAAVGVPDLTGPAGLSGPVNHQLPAWDLLTGSQAVNAVLAGLLHRAATGEGSYAEVALSDVALGAVADLGWLGEAQLRGQDRPKQGNHIYGSFGTSFRTADGGHVIVVAMTRRQWRALQEATGTAEVLARLGERAGLDLDLEENRYRLRDELVGVLAPWFAERDVEAVTKAFADTSVLWQRYRSLTEVAAAGDEPLLDEVDQPGIGPVVAARSAVRWPAAAPEAVESAPALGADTEAVLADELGLGQVEIAILVDEGVIR
ncbi:CoA transferase [Amycolatopsis carbonis]|uniref:CoA transferase n=1 Tax=Amycolatopsis carbonis TaxID=715471 RepID=A0A9Y2ILA3_9PSEU|nr:CoA transferase [Amycolatopsis sp. 2-15]WIX80413.1 CoA transferase [Amycolatopsis sp. 2-15]